MVTTVNAINPNVDTTARIFDNFYNYSPPVDSNEYSVVNSYFKSVFTDEKAANNLTTTFFQISKDSGVPVLTLLKQVEGQTAIELTATMAYFLNGLRSPSTLLGVNQPVTPNYYTARNVLL